MLIARFGVTRGNSFLFNSSSNSTALITILITTPRRILYVLWALPLLLLMTGNNVWASAEDRLERLHAAADNLHWSLDQSDYTITTNDSCEYLIRSTDRDIRRVIYFDPDGNRHVVRRDHYGNRLGTSVNLSNTALAGVMVPEGTLFIALRSKYRWYRGGRLIVRLEIPDCNNSDACPAMAENMNMLMVDVSSDPVFIELSDSPNGMIDPGNANVCLSSQTAAGDFIRIVQNDGANDTFQIFRIVGPGQIEEPPVVLSREQSTACATRLGCTF